MSQRRALITGITGQDGSYLSELLASEGTEVHGFVHTGDPLTARLKELVPSVILHEGDLRSTDDIRNTVDACEPDEVYHLAGASSVAQSWEDPVTTTDINGTGTVRVLDAVKRLGRRTGSNPAVLIASSAEIFGTPDVSPQTEETPLNPITPYGAIKAFGHRMAQILRNEGLHASAVILYNHESPRRPEQFVTRKITKAAARIAQGSTEPLRLGNMKVSRDWGFAGDYVCAMRAAVRADEPGDYVIATGIAHTIEDFVAAAFAAAGVPEWQSHVSIDDELVRPNDPAAFVGDASKAREILGWKPEVDFDALIQMMVKHDLTTP